MSKVSEKAIFNNYSPIPLNSKVSIIPKEFTQFNASNMGTYSTDNSKFLDGTLISKDIDSSSGGYGGIIKYVVKLDNSNKEITFYSSPTTYYFKLNPPPSKGGKKSRRKLNTKKSRKNRRKSSRRH